MRKQFKYLGFNDMGKTTTSKKEQFDIHGVIFSLPIEDILGLDQPWNLEQILSKLVEASNILMHNKNYDGHGWEEISHAIKLAEQKIELLKGNEI